LIGSKSQDKGPLAIEIAGFGAHMLVGFNLEGLDPFTNHLKT